MIPCHRLIVGAVFGIQLLLFAGLIALEHEKLSDAFDLQIKCLFALLSAAFVLFAFSLIIFFIESDPLLIIELMKGASGAVLLQLGSVFAMPDWWHCIILLFCAAATALALISLNCLLLQPRTLDSDPEAYPSSSEVNHRFPKCQLQDLNTFRRFTLDPNLAREQIMMHQARSNNRKSFIVIDPSDNRNVAYGNPVSDNF
ncbi:hypothetical protein PFISCL1PPCAC_28382 [Pristionchus fissidentatus]|uniref:Transmembrane protein n=1 Tax=Pristionchus fissidentatus TaxID=1538716 RepID=A0AAV5VMC3_9BILA|nr:hypothetical protein PFISCL1PPCAC_11850 [Pristionchus fissidentatus]GMT37085.1 hypothetical protein PFISCL1PPCAC_28382 [Pristionchus fissidentatus]